MALDVRERHAIVTGGSSGIGLALVRRLVASDAKVSVIALDDPPMEALRIAPPPGRHPVRLMAADVADRQATYAAVAQAVAEHGPCELLVTCAGIIRPGCFLDLTDEEFEREMAVDYFGTLWAARAVLPSMVERGRGAVVAVSSFAGLMGVYGYGAYTPPKFAVRGLCETLRLEMRPHGVHVACVFPTDVNTPQLAGEIPLRPPETEAMSGTVRPITADDVARAILAGVAGRRARIRPGRAARLLAPVVGAAPWLADRINDRTVVAARRRRTQTRSS